MPRHEATLDIDSETGSHAVRHLMEVVYDTLREELRASDGASKETLADFKEIRKATEASTPGTLKLVYETREEPFED